MEWTNDLTLKFVNIYEQFPILWDPTNKLYKVTPTKKEAWVAISEELEIGVAELKKKMNSLLATYRKVRQKFATPGKSGSGADDVDSSPLWFAFKAFAFLHIKYKPKSTINTEVDLEVTESQNEESGSSDEDTSHVVNSQEAPDDAQTEENTTQPPPMKIKKIFVSPKSKNVQKRAGGEDPKIAQAYTALQTALNTKKFDAYGEYIANVLRSMDKPTYAYVKKVFGEIIFKAESGTCYASRFGTHAQPCDPLSSPDYSRPTSRDSASYVPMQSPRESSVANQQPNVWHSQSLNQGSQSRYQLSNNDASSQSLNLHDENGAFQWH